MTDKNAATIRFPVGFKQVMIQGAIGALELMVHLPETLNEESRLLIVSHPHPLYGGNMHNKVVQTLAKAGQAQNMLVICYNFRGVGASEGGFDHGHGERYDLLAVLDFSFMRWGRRSLVLAGFSFGAWISAKVALVQIPERLLLVAPPVSLYPMEQLDLSAIRTTIVQGGADEVVDAQLVREWARLQGTDLLWRQGSTHYFHGQLLWLRGAASLALA